MQLRLEELPYQQEAITSVVRLFEGQERNTFDNATDEGIRFNYLRLSPEHLAANTLAVAAANGISTENLKTHVEPDFCVEMETGTGKTLVYLKTIFELYKEYGFAKFIILVPSVAIREGVLNSFATFTEQLEAIYGFRPDCFEYDSSRLHKVSTFIESQHPQIMVMTHQCRPDRRRAVSTGTRARTGCRSRIFFREVAERVEQREDFAFETTLAGRTYLRLIERFRTDGWQVELVYLALPSVEMSMLRVAERVAHGGHNIPLRDIERRFPRSLHNLFNEFSHRVDRCICFMNDGETPVLVFEQVDETRDVLHKDYFQSLQKEAAV